MLFLCREIAHRANVICCILNLNFNKKYLVSSHLISFHPIPSHLISSHRISQLISSHLIHLISSISFLISPISSHPSHLIHLILSISSHTCIIPSLKIKCLVSSHLISSPLLSSYLISTHLISSHLSSFCLIFSDTSPCRSVWRCLRRITAPVIVPVQTWSCVPCASHLHRHLPKLHLQCRLLFQQASHLPHHHPHLHPHPPNLRYLRQPQARHQLPRQPQARQEDVQGDSEPKRIMVCMKTLWHGRAFRITWSFVRRIHRLPVDRPHIKCQFSVSLTISSVRSTQGASNIGLCFHVVVVGMNKLLKKQSSWW